MRKFVFYITLFFLLLIFTLSGIELIFRLFVFKPESDFQRIYQAITTPNVQMPYSSEPFLNYINTPGYKDSAGNFEINSMGIRYPREITLQKPDSTLRILFMGGSTTFGEVDNPLDAFPALIEKKLRSSFLPNQTTYNDVECLNGAAHGLTSAELLTYFQFKYQYLQPDLLVIHTGFNDGFMYAKIHGSIYQPDYHNSRRVFYDVSLPSSIEKDLIYSKAFAYIWIRLHLKDFMKNSLEDNIFFLHKNDKIWFNLGNTAITDTTYNAFYNNIKTLIGIANTRHIKVLLVPDVCDSTMMPSNLNRLLPEGLRTNRLMMQKLAMADKNIVLNTLPDELFTHEMFANTDGVHVNDEGEKLKARFIEEFILRIINSTQQKK